jgi:hypothetical protein
MGCHRFRGVEMQVKRVERQSENVEIYVDAWVGGGSFDVWD